MYRSKILLTHSTPALPSQGEGRELYSCSSQQRRDETFNKKPQIALSIIPKRVRKISKPLDFNEKFVPHIIPPPHALRAWGEDRRGEFSNKLIIPCVSHARKQVSKFYVSRSPLHSYPELNSTHMKVKGVFRLNSIKI